MRGPLDIHRDLLAAQVSHEMVHLPRTVSTPDDLPEVLALPARSCVAMRFYRLTDGSLLAAAVPAGQWPDPDLLSAQVPAPPEAPGLRVLPGLRPASPDEVSSATEYSAAMAGPIGLPAGITLLVDTALEDSDVLYCPAGDTATVVGIRSRELMKATGGRAVPLVETMLAGPVG